MSPMKMNEIMSLDDYPDWEERLRRHDAFWAREVIDRPLICMSVPREKLIPKPVKKDFDSHRERWLDAEYQAEQALCHISNTEYLGDAIPHVCPNLGPEVFSSYFGMEMEYGERTSWSIPILETWDDLEKLEFKEDNFYWRKTLEMTDALLELGKGKFHVGITDLHPGGDAIAAFRDPINMNIDMIDSVDKVKACLDIVNNVYFHVFDSFYDKLRKEGQLCSNWAGITSTYKWYVPSNDFSCMISKEMFDDVFLEGIAEECRHMEASIYHLDGPGALRHLDSLLEIKELNAIQWVYGDGNGKATDWLHVYKKCQEAGKGIQIVGATPNEIDTLIEELDPRGVYMNVTGVENREEADEVLKKALKWT